MRRTRDILMILLAAVCVISGALLPQGSAVLQDHQLQGGETRTIDTVQLLLNQELSQAQILTLLSSPYTRISWDSSTKLTPQDAESYMSGALWDLMQAGLIHTHEATGSSPVVSTKNHRNRLIPVIFFRNPQLFEVLNF